MGAVGTAPLRQFRGRRGQYTLAAPCRRCTPSATAGMSRRSATSVPRRGPRSSPIREHRPGVSRHRLVRCLAVAAIGRFPSEPSALPLSGFMPFSRPTFKCRGRSSPAARMPRQSWSSSRRSLGAWKLSSGSPTPRKMTGAPSTRPVPSSGPLPPLLVNRASCPTRSSWRRTGSGPRDGRPA